MRIKFTFNILCEVYLSILGLCKAAEMGEREGANGDIYVRGIKKSNNW